MSLNWNWKDKIGEMDVVSYRDTSIITLNIYKCNGLAVILNEFKDKEGVEKYTMWGFFADKEHMLNCLGLKKGYTENIYASDVIELRMIKCKEQETMFQAFARASWNKDLTMKILKTPF